MVQNTVSNVNLFLSDVSQRDSSWDKHKSDSLKISNALSLKKSFAKRAYNLNECASWLLYSIQDDPDRPLKLSKASFCRDRACPLCQWRRSLCWTAVMHQQLPFVLEAYPSHRWIFATLTVRNCEISELRATLQAMNRALKSLVRMLRVRMTKVGYIRATEVTRANDDKAHPHFHVMFLLPSSYFKNNYIKQTEWSELWQRALDCDYKPIVDVRVVKPKGLDERLGALRASVMSALVETVKYSVKPSDLLRKSDLGDFSWLYEYFAQVKGLRLISTGGILKKFIKLNLRPSEESLLHLGVNDAESDQNDDEKSEVIFKFDRFFWRYRIADF